MSACKTSIKKVKDVCDATALVLDWFERENKPVTPQSLTDALGSRVPKPLIQKILDQLHTDNKLCVKDLKKIRFYYLRSTEISDAKDDNGDASSTPSSLGTVQTSSNLQQGGEEAAVPNEAGDTTALCDVALEASSLAEKQHRLLRWRGWPSLAERSAQHNALEKEVRQLELDVEALQRGCEADERSAQDTEVYLLRIRRAVRRYRRARQLWMERKGWAMRLLEATGGEEHSPQQVAGLLGCTTDADVGVSFETTAVTLTPQMLREIGLM
jgi:hypothetical protein